MLFASINPVSVHGMSIFAANFQINGSIFKDFFAFECQVFLTDHFD